MSTRLSRVLWLMGKDLARLWRNASAVTAVGLMVLVALLVRVDGERSSKAERAESVRGSVCLVVYWTRDVLVEHLTAHPPSEPRIRIVQAPAAHLGTASAPRYPANVTCVAEVRPPTPNEPRHAVTLLAPAGDKARLYDLRQWLQVSASVVAGSSPPPLLETGIKDLSQRQELARHPEGTHGAVDFTARKDALVGAMLMFSLHYFVCCGLFVSFTAFEKERGILQALVLTPASAAEVLVAKYLFHLLIALVPSAAIAVLLGVPWSWLPYLAPYLAASCLCFLAIATLIVSLTRTQTSASLISFCYLLLAGAIFGLSKHFGVFGYVRAMMFENYAFLISFFAFSGKPRDFVQVLGNAGVPLLVICIGLVAVAVMVFRRKGLR